MQRALTPGILPRVLPRAVSMAKAMHTSASATASTTPPNPPPTSSSAPPNKKEGDISSVFASLSHLPPTPLPPRFAALKSRLIRGHEHAITQSWTRLLQHLRTEIAEIAQRGPGIVPSVEFGDLGSLSAETKAEIRKRGVVVVRGVVPEPEARGWKEEVESYIRANPQTKAFPPETPQVFELYWSPPQLRARSHPRLLATQKALMTLWHTANPSSPISPSHPLTYADRLRIRHPGDAKFALGPHVDGGSVERWEEEGYGKGGVYDAVWQGRWEELDPFEASCRVPAATDLYDGAGSCSMFRMWQGWLAMSRTGPGEGTLQVFPSLKPATAYFLLRPFFAPAKTDVSNKDEFLEPGNWALEPESTSILQGAVPGMGQELSEAWHPHLELSRAMVNVPQVKPGDYVAWHCDTIHAVDKVHNGTADSSVMYIPACPLTELNAEYVARQRQAFLDGTPAPDFPGGKGESEHVGRPGVDFLKSVSDVDGERTMGFGRWDVDEAGLSEGQRRVLGRANEILAV